MLPFRARVDLGLVVIKGAPHSSKLQHHWNLTITHGGSYTSEEVQTVYSTASADSTSDFKYSLYSFMNPGINNKMVPSSLTRKKKFALHSEFLKSAYLFVIDCINPIYQQHITRSFFFFFFFFF